MDLTSVILLVVIVIVALIGVIVTKSPRVSSVSDGTATNDGIASADDDDRGREPPHSWLFPVGIIFMIGGLFSGLFALTMNVSAEGYSSTVNIDLVGYRTMVFIAAQVQWLLGWMLCCTRLVIRAVARFGQP